MKFLKSKTCHSNKIFFLAATFLQFDMALALDFTPQGKLIRRSPMVSKNPTVQMYFDPNKPPVINITPGRPTIVQFPSEVRSCTSASKIVSVSYADKTSQGSEKGGGESWYSAVVLNAGSFVQESKLQEQELSKLPPTAVICQIRVSNPDSNNQDTYSWQTIGVTIAGDKETYFVVYLLNQDSQINNLPTEEELVGYGAKVSDYSYGSSRSDTGIKTNSESIDKIKKKEQNQLPFKSSITAKNKQNSNGNNVDFVDLFEWKEKP